MTASHPPTGYRMSTRSCESPDQSALSSAADIAALNAWINTASLESSTPSRMPRSIARASNRASTRRPRFRPSARNVTLFIDPLCFAAPLAERVCVEVGVYPQLGKGPDVYELVEVAGARDVAALELRVELPCARMVVAKLYLHLVI